MMSKWSMLGLKTKTQWAWCLHEPLGNNNESLNLHVLMKNARSFSCCNLQ